MATSLISQDRLQPPETIDPNQAYLPYGETNRGRKRKNNEDMIFLKNDYSDPRRGTFAVTDGVGGKESGEVASGQTCQLLSRLAQRGDFITESNIAQISQTVTAGATTLVLAQRYGNGNQYAIMSVGDSSALILDVNTGQTTDITPRDENSEGKVTQVLGPEGENSGVGFSNPHTRSITLAHHEILILATDGFTRYLDNGAITPTYLKQLRNRYHGNNQTFVQQLIKTANQCGGSDNISVISIPYDPRQTP